MEYVIVKGQITRDTQPYFDALDSIQSGHTAHVEIVDFGLRVEIRNDKDETVGPKDDPIETNNELKRPYPEDLKKLIEYRIRGL